MVSAIATQRQWTFADLEELPDDENIYDIVGGEVVVRNAPPMDHGDVLTDLNSVAHFSSDGRIRTYVHDHDPSGA